MRPTGIIHAAFRLPTLYIASCFFSSPSTSLYSPCTVMLSATTIVVALLLSCAQGAPQQSDTTTTDNNSIRLPSEAFSPLVAQKVLATAKQVQNPPQYPQWTDRTSGKWKFFSPDTWTTGFFPATLYALNDRKSLCKNQDDTLANTDWLSLGRTWSAAEIPLEVKTGVGHDVGFLSFPFAEELELYVIIVSQLCTVRFRLPST